ncbi:MAG: hypothetical protein IPP38_10695 [Bacteroidetes bacterium]|nr:hypothetical protein [Bacteroidota bacterium]
MTTNVTRCIQTNQSVIKIKELELAFPSVYDVSISVSRKLMHTDLITAN